MTLSMGRHEVAPAAPQFNVLVPMNSLGNCCCER